MCLLVSNKGCPFHIYSRKQNQKRTKTTNKNIKNEISSFCFSMFLFLNYFFHMGRDKGTYSLQSSIHFYTYINIEYIFLYNKYTSIIRSFLLRERRRLNICCFFPNNLSNLFDCYSNWINKNEEKYRCVFIQEHRNNTHYLYIKVNACLQLMSSYQ